MRTGSLNDLHLNVLLFAHQPRVQDPRPDVLILDHLGIRQLMEALVLHQCATVELPTINELSTPSQLARPAFGEMAESAVLRGRAAYFPRLGPC